MNELSNTEFRKLLTILGSQGKVALVLDSPVCAAWRLVESPRIKGLTTQNVKDLYVLNGGAGTTPTAATGYQKVSLSVTYDQRTDTWRRTNGTGSNYAPTLIPKFFSSYNTTSSSSAQYIFDTIFVPKTWDATLLDEYMTNIFNDPSRLSTLNTDFLPTRAPHIGPAIYLNDLMQHKQPFGPTSGRRRRL